MGTFDPRWMSRGKLDRIESSPIWSHQNGVSDYSEERSPVESFQNRISFHNRSSTTYIQFLLYNDTSTRAPCVHEPVCTHAMDLVKSDPAIRS